MTIRTLEEITTLAGVDVLDHLDRQVDVPPCSGLMRQGDIYLIPLAPQPSGGLTPVGRDGLPLVRGESGGNTHCLVADGPVLWHPAQPGGQDVGTVVIPNGSFGYVLHPEHGAHCMAPGTWTVRRQREQAAKIRIVAD